MPDNQVINTSNDIFADALLHESIRESGIPYRKLTSMYSVQPAIEDDLSTTYSSF